MIVLNDRWCVNNWLTAAVSWDCCLVIRTRRPTGSCLKQPWGLKGDKNTGVRFRVFQLISLNEYILYFDSRFLRLFIYIYHIVYGGKNPQRSKFYSALISRSEEVLNNAKKYPYFRIDLVIYCSSA